LDVMRCLVLATHGDVATRRRLGLLPASKNSRHMAVGLPGLLHQFLASHAACSIFAKSNKRLCVDPECAAILVVLFEKLLQRFRLGPPHQTSSKKITYALVVIGVERQHGLIVADSAVNVAELRECSG